MVTLEELEHFCEKLGGRIGEHFRLPTPKSGYSGIIAFEWFFKDKHYWVVITREFFHTFSYKYKKEPKGPGLSQELALLRYIVKKDVNSIILSSMDDMKIYYFGANDWLNYGISHETISDFSDKEAYGLVSIPVKLLKRWYPEEPPKMQTNFKTAKDKKRVLEVGLDDFV